MIERLLMAAPPAPEPSANYVEVIGIPVLVAVVAAVLTSLLNNRRARTDRLAALRLETYRELVLIANQLEATMSNILDDAANGKSTEGAADEVDRVGRNLVAQMDLLPLVAREVSVKKIRDAYLESSAAVLKIEHARTLQAKKAVAKSAEVALREFVSTVVREGRSEIRRTRD